jgi:ABC-type histidine transport system ATPase subunit
MNSVPAARSSPIISSTSAFIADGRVAFHGSPAEFFDKAADPRVRGFLSRTLGI